MRIYLIRHGRQNSPLCNVDVPLSDAGRRQAELLGERLKKESIDAVWSSDLIRAPVSMPILSMTRSRHRGSSGKVSGRSPSVSWRDFPTM